MEHEEVPAVYDDGDGITLEFPLCTGYFSFKMTDEAAQELVHIIQNKLNARWK